MMTTAMMMSTHLFIHAAKERKPFTTAFVKHFDCLHHHVVNIMCNSVVGCYMLCVFGAIIMAVQYFVSYAAKKE